MSKIWQRILIHSCVAAALFVAAGASAQTARVFLSGTGDDANDCSNAATPCRSLQGAIDKSAANGEIIIMTSGGYGAATINKSLTVNAPNGVVAFDARTINISIAASDKVVIRGLSMNGAAFGDSYGIGFSSGGTLVVEDTKIAGFNYGINQSGGGSKLVVKNCDIRRNGTGILAWPPDGTALSSVAVEHSRFTTHGAWGFLVIGNVSAVVRDSVAIGNLLGFASESSSLSVPSLLLDGCVASNNSTGISVKGYNVQPPAVIRVTNSTIFGNTYGLSMSGGGQIISYGSNHLWRSIFSPPDGVGFSSTVARQ